MSCRLPAWGAIPTAASFPPAWNATPRDETVAEDFLRGLYRDGRLTASEHTGRLNALEALAAGKLRPALPSKDARTTDILGAVEQSELRVVGQFESSG